MFLTKKRVFLISLVGVLVITALALLQKGDFCYNNPWCNKLWDTINFIGYSSYPFVPLFLLSLISFFLREEVFRAWLRFTYWWLPVYIIAVYFVASNSSGGFGIPNVFDQQTVSFIFSGLFLIISLVIITIKSLTSPKETK